MAYKFIHFIATCQAIFLYLPFLSDTVFCKLKCCLICTETFFFLHSQNLWLPHSYCTYKTKSLDIGAYTKNKQKAQ